VVIWEFKEQHVAELPNSIEEVFDFTTNQIHQWETDLIYGAILAEKVDIVQHAIDAAKDEDIQLVDVLRVVLDGIPVSKDLPGNVLNRKPGINYEGVIPDSRKIRVKVSWSWGYAVITVHSI
jgi:hypothetical protein